MMMLFNLGWPRFASSPRAPHEGYAVTRPRIGLALGSGSARGWAHIGVIDALSEAGIEPDIVCGASMGALVGAAHVAGHLAELRQWAESATWRKIVRLTDVRLSGGGLINGRQVVAFLRELGIAEPIETYPQQYAAVATDMATGREIWLQSGPIHEAVRASIALPGILSPSRIHGKWLLDGGLSNPIPVSVCRALGADVIIAVNCRRRPAATSLHPALTQGGRADARAAGVAPPHGRKAVYASHPCPDALVKSSPTTRSLKSRSPPPFVSSQPQVFSP